MFPVLFRRTFILILAIVCLGLGPRYSLPIYLFSTLGGAANVEHSASSAILPEIAHPGRFLTHSEPSVSEKGYHADAGLRPCCSGNLDAARRGAIALFSLKAPILNLLALHRARAPPVLV